MRLDQQRRELPALPFAAADRERPQRNAVIALAPGYEISPLRLAAFDKILPRQLERRLDRLGPAADEKRMAETCRRMRDEIVGELFCGLRGEKTGMRIFELVKLHAHRGDNFGMRVAETGYGRAAGRIDVVLAILIANKNPLARHGRRVIVSNRPVQDMSHLLRRPFARGKT